MSLEKEINDGIKAAMLAKEKVRLAGLRAVKAEILLAKTADGSDEISDGAVLKIIQKLVKQRKESAAVYTQNNRPELAENGWPGRPCWKCVMPKQLSGEELETVLKAIISAGGAAFAGGYGKVMGVAANSLPGRPSSRAIQAVKNYCSSAHSVINRSNGVGNVCKRHSHVCFISLRNRVKCCCKAK